MKKYAISDIHGCNITFNALLEKLNLQKEDELYLLGDYIDRGPNSKGVIDTILQLQKKGFQVHCLMGNHEQAMLDSRTDSSMRLSWLSWGGEETLQSFGIHNLEEIPSRYWDFLENLNYFVEVDDYILVHAGLDFYAKNPLMKTHPMLWARGWYRDINKDWLGTRKIVHGHTPARKDDIESMCLLINQLQYIDIDAGCYCYDWLCAFELTKQQLTFQKRMDEVYY